MTKEYKKYTVRMSKDVRFVAEVGVVASSEEGATRAALDELPLRVRSGVIPSMSRWLPDVSERNEVIDIVDVEEVGS